MFIKNIFLILLVILSFNSCGKNKQIDIPNWYLNSPQNNSQFLFGVGEGKNLKEAKLMALDDMSSRLMVTVDSLLNKNIQTSKNNTGLSTYNKDINFNIDIKTKKFQFTNIKVLNSTRLNNKFFVVLQVDRRKTFLEKQKQFYLLNKSIEDKYKQAQQLPILEKIYILQNIEKIVKKAQQKAFTLYAINNKFNYKTFLKNYQQYSNKIIKLKNNLKIKISSNEQSKIFLDQLTQLLNKNGYKTSSKNYDVKIILNNRVKYSVSRGWQIVKVFTTISVSSDNKIIANQIINTIGRSGSTKENALANASKNFKNKISAMGLDKILFNK